MAKARDKGGRRKIRKTPVAPAGKKTHPRGRSKTEKKAPKPAKAKIRDGRLRKGHVRRGGRLGSVDSGRGKKSRLRPSRSSKKPQKKRVTLKPVKKTPAKKAPPKKRRRPAVPLSPRKPRRPTKKPQPKKPQPKKRRPPSRKPPSRKPRPPARKPRPPRKRPPARKPKPPSRKRKPRPVIVGRSEESFAAHHTIEEYLAAAQLDILSSLPEVSLAIKTFINADGTVDGDLRISDVPELWRTEDGFPTMAAYLSALLIRLGTLPASQDGGRFFISLGIRFGPRDIGEIENLAALYKRFRGLFQVASHPLDASFKSGLQNAVAAMSAFVKSLMSKRGLPPAVVFIRITWMPSGMTPGRYEGEAGGGR